MQGASRAAFGQARDRLDGLAAGDSDMAAIGEDLFAVARLLDSEPALRRALTDASKPKQARAGLVRALLGGRLTPPAAELVAEMAGTRWAVPRDLADAVEQLAVLATAAAAAVGGGLDEVEDALFRFGRIASGDPSLYAALTSARLPAEVKQAVLGRLLDGKTSRAARRLITQAVLYPRGRSLEAALEDFAKLAASWRDRLIAVVRVATDLTGGQRDRLTAALSGIYGHGVQLNVLIDPGIVGGMSVEIGDEVIDGTLSSLLAQLRRRLAA